MRREDYAGPDSEHGNVATEWIKKDRGSLGLASVGTLSLERQAEAEDCRRRFRGCGNLETGFYIARVWVSLVCLALALNS